MKKIKSERTALERRLEEEMRRESQEESVQAVQTEAAQENVAPQSDTLEEDVERDIDTIETEIEEMRDQLLRARADFDNYRKRMAREAERTRKLAAEALLRDLLPVIDNLDRALNHHEESPTEALVNGLKMVLKQMHDVLDRSGVRPIAAVGEVFDPQVHEAVAHTPSTKIDRDNVMEEYQRGYLLGDVVLRPSKVVVSSGETEESAANDN